MQVIQLWEDIGWIAVHFLEKQAWPASALAAATGAGCAGHRAIDAEDFVARDIVVSEGARHDLRRGRSRWRTIVRDSTDGNFDIQVFAAGEIVPGLQAADAAAAGTVEACHTASYYYWGKDPTYALATAVPFGMNVRQMNAWIYYGGGKDLLNEFYATQGLYGLPAATPARRWAAGTARRSTRVADLKGLKMRIGGFAGKVIEQARRGAAADRRRRHLPGAGEGHDRRRRMGRSL